MRLKSIKNQDFLRGIQRFESWNTIWKMIHQKYIAFRWRDLFSYIIISMKRFVLSVNQRRVEALPSMHCNSLIFTIMIFHNVSWKSCGYLFRYFATKSSYFCQINDFCFIWCFNNVQLYANRNLYWPVFRVNAQVSKVAFKIAGDNWVYKWVN
jgi:hypothetical protein